MNKINEIIKYCRSFEMQRFKEDDRSIRTALHIPYSGFGNPDYVDFYDYLMDDICQLIMQVVEDYNYDDMDIRTIADLKAVWERIDDDSTLHSQIESSLTWQQGLRESEIIINNCENEETDTGLWQGLQPDEAITAKAFWTYKNEVFQKGLELIEEYEVAE